MGALKYHEIASIEDEHYDSWLDLYQVSFPLNEQMKVGTFNRMLRQRRSGDALGNHFLSVLDDTGAQMAIAMYCTYTGTPAAVLWYLAVAPEHRSKGLGSMIYAAIVRRIFEIPGIEAILLEVEAPNGVPAHCPEIAARRIQFYRRQGAKLLEGIRYIQSVGWQPPVEMNIMVHPRLNLTPQEAYNVARAVFEGGVEQCGEIGLR